MSDVRWIATYEEEGEVAFRIGRAGDDLVAEWIGTLRLSAKRDGSAHSYEVEPSADPREVEKIKRGSGRLLLRQLAGELALHGAAITRDGLALVLLGRSGQGKSTMAAAACADAGFALLADDAVALERAGDVYTVTPTEGAHWLDAASRAALGWTDEEGKLPIPAPVAEAPARLACFVELAFADVPAPVLRDVEGVAALGTLVPQVARFVLDEPELHRRELEVLSRLVDRVPFVRLERPRDLRALPVAAALLEALLANHR